MENDNSQLDPTIVNLTKSIRQNETGGNFTAKGKSGEYGAYQFTQPTWDADSKKYGINVPLDQASPLQQNEVAYKTVADLKAKGMNVGQIASYWNSGKPDAYLDPNSKGTNNYGADYDVPNYAKKVATTYQDLKNGGTGTPSNPALASTLFGGASPATAEASGGQQQPKKKSNLLPAIATGVGILGAGALALGTGGLAIPEELAGASALGLGDAATGGGIISGLWQGAKGLASKLAPGLELEGGINLAKDAKGLYDSVTGKTSGTSDGSGSGDGSGADTQAIEGHEDQINQQNQAQQQAIQDSQTAAKNTAQAYQTVLGQTATGQKMIQDPLVQEGTTALGHYGVTPDEENGRYTTQGNQTKVDDIINNLNDEENQLHDAEGATGNISELSAKAKEIVRRTLPSTSWDEADAAIDRDVDSYRAKFGSGENKNTLPLGSGGVGRIRSEGYKAYDRNSSAAVNGARRALGSAANSHMLEKTQHKELIGKLHKEKQKLVHGKKVLKQLDGKKIYDNAGVAQSLLRHYGKYAGLAIGDKLGGALGAVIGEMVGTHLTRAVDKRYGKHIFDSRAIRKGIELLQSKNPEIHNEVVIELKKHGIRTEKERQEVIKTAHQLWQEEEFKDKKETKRKAYKDLKKGILEDRSRESIVEKSVADHYEPYPKKLPSIDFGKKGTSKHKKTVKGLLTIR